MLRLSPSSFKPRKRNAPRPAWKVADAFRQWLRGRPCAFAGPACDGKIEAAHMADPASKGLGTKAADRNCIPLCRHHHHRHTTKGWSALGITREQGTLLAGEYWRNWPGKAAWESRNG